MSPTIWSAIQITRWRKKSVRRMESDEIMATRPKLPSVYSATVKHEDGRVERRYVCEDNRLSTRYVQARLHARILSKPQYLYVPWVRALADCYRLGFIAHLFDDLDGNFLLGLLVRRPTYDVRMIWVVNLRIGFDCESLLHEYANLCIRPAQQSVLKFTGDRLANCPDGRLFQILVPGYRQFHVAIGNKGIRFYRAICADMLPAHNVTGEPLIFSDKAVAY